MERKISILQGKGITRFHIKKNYGKGNEPGHICLLQVQYARSLAQQKLKKKLQIHESFEGLHYIIAPLPVLTD